MRTPRAQSAAGIGRLPTGRTSPSRTAAVAVPTSTRRFSTCSCPGFSSGASARPAERSTGPRPSRGSRNVVQAPGSGVHRPDQPVDRGRRRGPVDPGVVDGDLRRVRDAVGRLRAGRPACRPRSRPWWPPAAPAPASASRSEQRRPRCRSAPIGLGDHAEHRAGVQALLQLERGGAGDLVAVPQRGLHRRGAAPGRQQREVQVDPAVRGDRQRRPAAPARRRRPPGSSPARARAAGRGTRARRGRAGVSTGMPASSASRPTGRAGQRAGRGRPARPAG